MDDRLVLALDGSSRVCGAALLRLDPGIATAGPLWQIVTRRSEIDSRGQAKVLLRLVNEMVLETGRGPEGLGAVVVGIGPGTFTGVRITVATARALGLALAIPVLGVSTLGALASSAAATAAVAAPPAKRPRLLVPVIDARRGQMFYGLYRAAGEGGDAEYSSGACPRWRREADFAVCDRHALGEVVAAEVAGLGPIGGEGLGSSRASALVVGEAAAPVGALASTVAFRAADVEAECLVMGQGLLEEPGDKPQGARLSAWLAEAIATGRVTSSRDGIGAAGTPESVTPIYVRPPDADIHITKMRDPWGDDATTR